MQDAFTHVIPTDGNFPSQLIVGSMLQAACWRELYHGSGNMDQILEKKSKTCRSVGRRFGYTVIHPGLRFQTTRNLKPNIFLGFICFHDFICFLRFFCPLTHCLFCFTSFLCTGSIFAYTDFSVVPLGPWYVIISISNRF